MPAGKVYKKLAINTLERRLPTLLTSFSIFNVYLEHIKNKFLFSFFSIVTFKLKYVIACSVKGFHFQNQ